VSNSFTMNKSRVSRPEEAPQAESDDAGDRGQRAIQSIEVGGQLLLALADASGAMPLKDLAAQAGLSASRAHPYLVSFGRLGLIEQDAVTGRYALGPAALRIGLACLNQWDPLRAAEPVARELAESTGHAVALAVWGNFGPTIVRLIEARQPLHVALRVGSVMSIHDTATGRAFAGVLPPGRLAEAVAGAFGELASASTRASRAPEIEQIRAELKRHGVTRAVGRPIPGVNAFSAPALDLDGQPALVITALDHQDRLPSDWNGASARAVRTAAAQVSARLGGTPRASN
jgi:DNA-binding IclR family transcriptional regulator